jgi:hypothetical protein
MHKLHMPSVPYAIIAGKHSECLMSDHSYTRRQGLLLCLHGAQSQMGEESTFCMPQHVPGVGALSLAVLTLVHHSSPL